MKKQKITLRSRGGSYQGQLTIYPLRVCGSVEFYCSGDVRRAEGCAPGPGHALAGGRECSVIEMPKGYEIQTLTAGQTAAAWNELAERGLDPRQYMADDTVHGTWKISCRQSAVMVKKDAA